MSDTHTGRCRPVVSVYTLLKFSSLNSMLEWKQHEAYRQGDHLKSYCRSSIHVTFGKLFNLTMSYLALSKILSA